MARKNVSQIPFEERLVLFKYFLQELNLNSLEELSVKLNGTEFEGVNESGNTYFSEYLIRFGKTNIPKEKLLQYDENILRHTRHIGAKRGGLQWKYFQYIALLFTEIYLDRYFSDAENFCESLNDWLKKFNRLDFQPYTADKLNKLAFMCATGSGKTLIMHVNILQYRYYFDRAKKLNSNLSINKTILITPNEGMSKQHLEELALSSIPAQIFVKDGGNLFNREDEVSIIDINKLKEEGKNKTVSIDSFEQNNLVLVDEGHRGLSGDVWYNYRTILSENGFAFEYSATFKQALNANAAGNTQKAKAERALMEEYGKSIITDYSYKYFYGDGYGKDYRILNLKGNVDSEQKHLYLTGCLLAFYQQLKLFETKTDELKKFNIEKPLLVFVGNRVTAPIKSSNLTQAERELLTDVEEVLLFLNKFLSNRAKSVENINAILTEDSGLIDERGHELFYKNFDVLKEIFPKNYAEIFSDILRVVFNAEGSADEPRLIMKNFRQVPGEIGLKVGEYGEYFGVINIGNTAGLLKLCERKGIITGNEEFISESLFRNINTAHSKINMLIGSRKFTEGWNSWRVSTMGLINFAKGEGAQAIQLFGRGVRLKGRDFCLKRSDKLGFATDYIKLLETLNIFGVKAQYMEEFKIYLEREGAPVIETICEYNLPVIIRVDKFKKKNLYTIKVKDDADFKRQAARLILDKPDAGFFRYLTKNKIVFDCRSKIQTIDSTGKSELDAITEESALPAEILPLLDVQRIFDELQEYKISKRYHNICIVKKNLLDILAEKGWYGLLIPKNHLEINTPQKLETATDYAIMALKSYMEKFFKYEKNRWEEPRLTYAVLDEHDKNFIDKYTVTYAPQNESDKSDKDLEDFISEVSALLQKNNCLKDKKEFLNRLILFDFASHLYAPLICLKESNLKIKVAPVALNDYEMKFVDRLKKYVESHDAELADKSLYLLRNKSKVGMGFFEAGNFYPDYILWIDTADKQYITFIDPKGLLHMTANNPKIEFHKKIKDLEKRLAPTADGKKIILNSFIMSSTDSAELRNFWNIFDKNLADLNIYTLDDSDCVDLMIEKILADF